MNEHSITSLSSKDVAEIQRRIPEKFVIVGFRISE